MGEGAACLIRSAESHGHPDSLLTTFVSSMHLQTLRISIIMMFLCVCVLPSHIFWTPGCLWTYQPGSHRGKLAQGFSSTFLLRYRSSFVDRDVEVLCTNELIVLHLLGVFIFTFFSLGKIPVRVTAPGFELTSQPLRCRRYQPNHRGDWGSEQKTPFWSSSTKLRSRIK